MSRGRGEEESGGIFEGGSSAGGGIGGERRMRRMGVWWESRVERECVLLPSISCIEDSG